MKENIKFPKNIYLTKQNNKLVISYRWNRIYALLLFIGLVVFVSNSYTLYKDNLNYLSIFKNELLFLFGIGFLVIAYLFFAFALNFTSIEISEGILKVITKPIPWVGNKQFKSKKIKQVFYTKTISFENSTIRKRERITYEIYLKLKGKKRNVELIKGLESREQVKFIEKEIEKYLDIEDIMIIGGLR